MAPGSEQDPRRAKHTVHLTNGQSRLQLSAEAIETFTIEASTDLENWAPIGTNSVAVGGSALVTDPDAATYPNRFYRAAAKRLNCHFSFILPSSAQSQGWATEYRT